MQTSDGSLTWGHFWWNVVTITLLGILEVIPPQIGSPIDNVKQGKHDGKEDSGNDINSLWSRGKFDIQRLQMFFFLAFGSFILGNIMSIMKTSDASFSDDWRSTGGDLNAAEGAEEVPEIFLKRAFCDWEHNNLLVSKATSTNRDLWNLVNGGRMNHSSHSWAAVCGLESWWRSSWRGSGRCRVNIVSNWHICNVSRRRCGSKGSRRCRCPHGTMVWVRVHIGSIWYVRTAEGCLIEWSGWFWWRIPKVSSDWILCDLTRRTDPIWVRMSHLFGIPGTFSWGRIGCKHCRSVTIGSAGIIDQSKL